MNITRVICAGVLLLAGSGAAQEGASPSKNNDKSRYGDTGRRLSAVR